MSALRAGCGRRRRLARRSEPGCGLKGIHESDDIFLHKSESRTNMIANDKFDRRSNRCRRLEVRREPAETFCTQPETRVDFFLFFCSQPFEKSRFGRINPRKSKQFCLVLFGFAWKEFALWLNPRPRPVLETGHTDPRLTIGHSTLICRGRPVEPEAASRRISAAIEPISKCGKRTVVSGGCRCWAISRSS